MLEQKADIKPQVSIAEAFDVIKHAILDDSEYAWSWQCNLACPFLDENIPHKAANKAAARILRILFGVDITKHQNYMDMQKRWG
jgi:hypothetical protein